MRIDVQDLAADVGTTITPGREIRPEEAARWLAATPLRRARRSFTGEAIRAVDLQELGVLAQGWNPWPGARTLLLAEAPESVFVGIVGMYGGISHSPSALVFTGDARAWPEMVGYTGEALVLEATARGLDTCWVGGLFRPGVIPGLLPVSPDEHIYAISALGHARDRVTAKEKILFGASREKTRRSVDEIAPGHERWPAWARSAALAARIAPSAMNRQPWRFALEDGTLRLTSAGADTPRVSKRLDCGIAMLHAELGARGEGVTGRWELSAASGVARFRPSEP